MNEGLMVQDQQALATLSVIELSKQDYEADRDLVNQLLGQVQMADAMSKFSMTVSISKLAYVKEHKLYKTLKGKKSADGQQFSDAIAGEKSSISSKSADGQQFMTGTWDEFCALLGRSHQQVDEEIRNLKTFGEAALESMSAMGIGYRDLRQFRRLPADQKSELIEAAKAGDTATLLELAEDLITKHAKDKAALQKDLDAKDQRIARHAAKIQEFEDKEDQWAALPVHQQLAPSTSRALGLVQGELRQGFLALAAAHADAGDGTDSRVLMAGHLGQLQQLINALREEFALADVVGDGTPEWKKWNLANPNGHPNLPDSATWRPAA
jgi:hypothetical protein